MGQYYRPCILDADNNVTATMYSHDYGNGLKLMEHSWMRNDFVAEFESLLVLDGPRRVVWGGDYADPEPGTETDEHENGLPLYFLAGEMTPIRFDCKAVRDHMKSKWFFDSYTEGDLVPLPDGLPKYRRYLLNHDTMEYVDKHRVPGIVETNHRGVPVTWKLHPLPLLTAEGNGRGGGDFGGDDPHGFVGRWARQRISAATRKPDGPQWSRLEFDLLPR